jgi:hypothetical protein
MTMEQQVELDVLRVECMQAARDAQERGAVDLSIVFGIGVCVGALIWCDAEPSRGNLISQLRGYKAELESLGRGSNV